MLMKESQINSDTLSLNQVSQLVAQYIVELNISYIYYSIKETFLHGYPEILKLLLQKRRCFLVIDIVVIKRVLKKWLYLQILRE